MYLLACCVAFIMTIVVLWLLTKEMRCPHMCTRYCASPCSKKNSCDSATASSDSAANPATPATPATTSGFASYVQGALSMGDGGDVPSMNELGTANNVYKGDKSAVFSAIDKQKHMMWLPEVQCNVALQNATLDDRALGNTLWGNEVMNNSASWQSVKDMTTVSDRNMGHGNDILTKTEFGPEFGNLTI